MEEKNTRKKEDCDCVEQSYAAFVKGSAIGLALGTVSGTYEAIRYKGHGRIYYIGQTAMACAGILGFCMGAGNWIHCTISNM